MRRASAPDRALVLVLILSLTTCDTHTRYPNSPSAFDALNLRKDQGTKPTARGTSNERGSQKHLETGDMACKLLSQTRKLCETYRKSPRWHQGQDVCIVSKLCNRFDMSMGGKLFSHQVSRRKQWEVIPKRTSTDGILSRTLGADASGILRDPKTSGIKIRLEPISSCMGTCAE